MFYVGGKIYRCIAVINLQINFTDARQFSSMQDVLPKSHMLVMIRCIGVT